MSKLFGGKSLVDFAKEGQPDGSKPGAAPARFAASAMAKRGPMPLAERHAVLKVDPKRCRPWKFHDRTASWFDAQSCGDVIESIRANGQFDPGVVRTVHGEAEYDYEFITGSRRRYACEVLGIEFKVEVRDDLTDQDAAVLMHVENNDRQDITPMERAHRVAQHLKVGLFKTPDELADKFKISRGQLTKMIRAASLMEVGWVRKLMPDIRTVPVEDSYKVAALLETEPTKGIVTKAGEQMVRSGSQAGKAPAAILKLLVAAPNRSRLSSAFKRDYNVGKKGRVAVTRNPKGKVTLAFRDGIQAADREDVVSAVTRIVDDLIAAGPSVS